MDKKPAKRVPQHKSLNRMTQHPGTIQKLYRGLSMHLFIKRLLIIHLPTQLIA